MLPQEIFKIEHRNAVSSVFQFPRQGWSSLKFSLKSKILNENGQLVGEGEGEWQQYNSKQNNIRKLPNIGVKVPDMEWETTGQS